MKLNAGMLIGLGGAAIGLAVGLAAVIMTGDVTTIVIFSVVGVFSTALIYFVFIKPSMNYSRLLKTGIKGTGTILSIQETGTRINNQPLCKIELQVEIPGKPAYTTITKSVISYFQASQFQPGVQVPVMVDPNNNMKVILIRQGDLPSTGTNPLMGASSQQMEELKQRLEEMQREHDRIKAIGIYCKAIVTKYTPMGVNVNGNNPLVTLEVQVLPDAEPAFSATVKGAIKQTSIPLFQPGEEIFVKYDPSDKTKVTIEHS